MKLVTHLIVNNLEDVEGGDEDLNFLTTRQIAGLWLELYFDSL